MDIKNLIKKDKETEGFIVKKEKFMGHTFSILTYRIVENKSFYDNELFEARGLTIDETTGDYYLSIHKFFNEGETEDTLKKWDNSDRLEIREKIDGSLIIPVMIDNKIYMKTKNSFNSYQAKKATEFINKNPVYKQFIRKLFEDRLIPIFEYISPFNQIVINYNKEDLILLHIRNLDTGEYLTYGDLLSKTFTDIPIAKLEMKTYKEIKELANTIEGIEGWVVRNLDKPLYSQFRKIKTRWYFDLHRLISPNMFTDNIIIRNILEETIDDILSVLNENSEKRNHINYINQIIVKYIDKTIKNIMKVYKLDLERKDFALKFKDNEWFSIAMRCWTNKTEDCLYENLKKYILRNTSKKEQAENWIEIYKYILNKED